jgi:DNA-binding transcriptional MerR regulator
MGNYITIKQACECYNVTRKTIYNWRNNGLLKEKIEGRAVLLLAESIEAQITHKLPHHPSKDLEQLTQSVHKLTAKIEVLEALITQLLPKQGDNNTQELPNANVKNTQELPKVTRHDHYKQRSQNAIDKARQTFIELGMPSITKKELAERAGVSRGTVQKYWAKITQLDLPKL